jgi:hypothetical protein
MHSGTVLFRSRAAVWWSHLSPRYIACSSLTVPVAKLKQALTTNLPDCFERLRESNARCMFYACTASSILLLSKICRSPRRHCVFCCGKRQPHQLLADATC